MVQDNLAAISIGSIARQVLVEADEAEVWGSTSRGTFLRLPVGWIVFLSGETWRGPLTVNLRGNLQALESLLAGSRIAAQKASLSTRDSSLFVDLSGAETWQPPPLAWKVLSHAERCSRLVSTVSLALSRVKWDQNSSLLKVAMGILGGNIHSPVEESPVQEVRSLVQALHTRQLNEAVNIIGSFLGLGSGLTPSGDDLVIGTLLALNRWRGYLLPGLDTSDLNPPIVEMAWDRTSKLSASLVHCATLGEADERLITALDGIITGDLELSDCADRLLSWGSSSGCDALAGMALVFLAH